MSRFSELGYYLRSVSRISDNEDALGSRSSRLCEHSRFAHLLPELPLKLTIGRAATPEREPYKNDDCPFEQSIT